MNASTTTLPWYCAGETSPEGARWIAKSGEGRGSGAAEASTARLNTKAGMQRITESISSLGRCGGLFQQCLNGVVEVLLQVVEERIATQILVADHALPVDEHHGRHVKRLHDGMIEVRQHFLVGVRANRKGRLELLDKPRHQHLGLVVESRGQHPQAVMGLLLLQSAQNPRAVLAMR